MNPVRGRSIESFGALALSSVLLAACEGPPRSPVAPAARTPITTAVTTSVRGLVLDTFWRPVDAARVEIITGPLVGTFTMSDGQGRFDFTSTSANGTTVTVRVSKNGFETTTSTATWQKEQFEGRSFVAWLPIDDPPLALHAGDYRLNIRMDLATADRRPGFPAHIACTGFPEELASRTYDATISEYPRGERGVTIKGPTVRTWASTFGLYVAGSEAAVNLESAITEEFAGNRYLDLMGGPVATRFTLDGDAVHIPIELDFRYCELFSVRGIYNDCSQVPLDLVVRQSWCTDRVVMTFTRR